MSRYIPAFNKCIVEYLKRLWRINGMKRSSHKIIICCLIFSLLLPNFSVSVLASEVSGESEPEAIIQEEKLEDELFEDAVSENDVTEDDAIEDENSEDNADDKEFEEDFYEDSEQAEENFIGLPERNNIELLDNNVENGIVENRESITYASGEGWL